MPTSHRVYSSSGKLWIENYDHNRKAVSRELGNATYLKSIYKIFETKEFLLELEFDYLNETQKLLIPRADLRKSELLKYAKLGLNVNESNAVYLIEHITAQEKKKNPKLLHQGIGWDTLNDEATGEIKYVFKGIQALGMKSDYHGKLPIQPQGKPNGFRKFIQDYINGTPLTLAVATGLSSVLVGYLGDNLQCGNLVVHLYGDSTTGKTTAAKLAVSIQYLTMLYRISRCPRCHV